MISDTWYILHSFHYWGIHFLQHFRSGNQYHICSSHSQLAGEEAIELQQTGLHLKKMGREMRNNACSHPIYKVWQPLLDKGIKQPKDEETNKYLLEVIFGHRASRSLDRVSGNTLHIIRIPLSVMLDLKNQASVNPENSNNKIKSEKPVQLEL